MFLKPFVTVGQLATLLDGRLEFADLPPLEGGRKFLGRICTDIDQVADGDVFWAIDGMKNSGCHWVEEAFARGAAGVVVSGYHGVPWPGRWIVHLTDAGEAFLSSRFQAIAFLLKLAPGENLPRAEDRRTARTTLCRIVPAGKITLLDWSGNATPDLWPTALEELRGLDQKGRSWIVCGDLCSPQWDHGIMHERIGADAVYIGNANGLVACGQFARNMALGARHAGLPPSRVVACRHLREATNAVQRWMVPGDRVLVAGSRHLNMVPLVENLERNQAAKAA